MMMDYDISEPISQGSDEAQEAENRRIAEIADELSRLCRVYEAQFGVGEGNVTPIVTRTTSGGTVGEIQRLLDTNGRCFPSWGPRTQRP